jgi:hypothetical protein
MPNQVPLPAVSLECTSLSPLGLATQHTLSVADLDVLGILIICLCNKAAVLLWPLNALSPFTWVDAHLPIRT